MIFERFLTYVYYQVYTFPASRSVLKGKIEFHLTTGGRWQLDWKTIQRTLCCILSKAMW